MKKYVGLMFSMTAVIFLAACNNEPYSENGSITAENKSPDQNVETGHDGLVYKKYSHPDFNFTIDMPVGWGGYQAWGNTFRENEPFCGGCESFGPKVPDELPGMDILPYEITFTRHAKNEKNFENKKNQYEKLYSTFSTEQKQSFKGWMLVYSGGPDVTDKCQIEPNAATSCDENDENGKYQSSHWLMDREDYLYDFVYNRDFPTHAYILNSITFK